ncbi:MAG: Gfo/Idh/MocA family oxidoreductase [Muribaculaceae bacterium]|nr:Gfo/Idh/MocA family oxidoreductase [Muribaculaceae bacterium]
MNNLLGRWRSHRNRRMIGSPYESCYAFVGVGSHALQNLYPVIQYLGIRLKYICCRHADKIPDIERKFGVTATTSLDTILDDESIRGVFVCASPDAHYGIVSRIVKSGKYVFVEKPPCSSLQELDSLIEDDPEGKVMVGMQKRFSPFTRDLMRRLRSEKPRNYSLSYHTGAYPEGNPVTDLFIHPVDLCMFLFGRAEIKGCLRAGSRSDTTIQLLLAHENVNGTVELSTAYSWGRTEESLRVNTSAGEYRLDKMERLSFSAHPPRILGIPLEKTGLFTSSEQVISLRDGFSPMATNNQIYAQGFLSEIKAFADLVEFSKANDAPLKSIVNTYKILEYLDS